MRNVRRHHGHIVPALQFIAQIDGRTRLRMRGIEQHRKRLAQLLQFRNRARLGARIRIARQIQYASVRGHHHADRGMILDHAARAGFRRFIEGNRPIRPRRGHHPRFAVFIRAQRAVHHIAHAIHQPHARAAGIGQRERSRLVRHKANLIRHHHAPVPALRQFIPHSIQIAAAFNAGQNHKLHEPPDEARFARSHRTDDADVNIAIASARYVPIKCILIHGTASQCFFTKTL